MSLFLLTTAKVKLRNYLEVHALYVAADFRLGYVLLMRAIVITGDLSNSNKMCLQ